MKPVQTVKIDHQGNLPTEGRTAFSLDQNSLTHLMGVLTDLYTDTLGAVIREYSTNAADAHAEAKNPAPIEVTLPTALVPTLTIRDYGIGMSRDTVEQCYGSYGFSTKRNTNDQTGMLGLGTKSALTYTTQFTVTSVKDGKRVVVVVSRDENGVGFLQTVSHTETADPNGTTIMIPIPGSDVGRACEKARDFFKYWKPGSVLVNDEAPTNFLDVARDAGRTVIEIDDDIFVLSGYAPKGSTIVMGGVGYNVSNHSVLPNNVNGSNWSIVAFVPMGSVTFSPAREEVSDSETTSETLRTIKSYVTESYTRKIREQVEGCTSIGEAAVMINDTQNFLRHTIRTWNFETIPDYVTFDSGYSWSSSHLDNTVSKMRSALRPHGCAELVAIVGTNRPTAKLKTQTRQYFDVKNMGDNRCVFLSECLDTRFFKHVIDVSTIREQKIATPNAPKIERGKYRQVLDGNRVAQVDAVSSDFKYLVMVPAAATNPERTTLVHTNGMFGRTAFLASIYKNGEEKFKKQNPTAITIVEWLELMRTDLVAAYTADLAFGATTSTFQVHIDVDTVYDPELKWYLEADAAFTAGQQNVIDRVNAFNSVARHYDIDLIDQPYIDDLLLRARKVRAKYVALDAYIRYSQRGTMNYPDIANGIYLLGLHKASLKTLGVN